MQSDDSSAGSRDIQENSSYPTGRFVSHDDDYDDDDDGGYDDDGYDDDFDF